jgi:hypothetical protein
MLPEWINMELAVDYGLIPFEIATHLNWRCQCGWSYVIDKQRTHRKCSNPVCPYHLAERAVEIYHRFNYKGIGAATCLSYLKAFQLDSQFDLLDAKLYENDSSAAGRMMHSYAMQPRNVYLHEIVEMASIPGIQTKASEYFSGYKSFEEYFRINTYLAEYKDMLISAQKYFKVSGVSQTSIVVRATGRINGYPRRQLFFDNVNQLFGGKVFVDYKESWTNQCQALVCDNQMEMTPKLTKALNLGIPVYTSKDFLIGMQHTYGRV